MIDRFVSDEVKRFAGNFAFGWFCFPTFQQDLIRVVGIRKSYRDNKLTQTTRSVLELESSQELNCDRSCPTNKSWSATSKHVYGGQHRCCKLETSKPDVSFRKHSKITIERVFRAPRLEINNIQQFCQRVTLVVILQSFRRSPPNSLPHVSRSPQTGNPVSFLHHAKNVYGRLFGLF